MTKRRTGTLAWLPVILGHESLDPTETLLLVGIADHVDETDTCFVGIERLAKYARVSYGTARRRLAALEERGFITRERKRRDDGNMSVYIVQLQPVAFGEPAPNLRDGPSPTLVRDDQRASGRAMTSARQGARAEPPSDEPPSSAPQEPASNQRARRTRLADAAEIIGDRAAQRPGVQNPPAMRRAVAAGVIADRHAEAYEVIAAEPGISPADLAERLEPTEPAIPDPPRPRALPVDEVLSPEEPRWVEGVAALAVVREQVGFAQRPDADAGDEVCT